VYVRGQLCGDSGDSSGGALGRCMLLAPLLLLLLLRPCDGAPSTPATAVQCVELRSCGFVSWSRPVKSASLTRIACTVYIVTVLRTWSVLSRVTQASKCVPACKHNRTRSRRLPPCRQAVTASNSREPAGALVLRTYCCPPWKHTTLKSTANTCVRAGALLRARARTDLSRVLKTWVWALGPHPDKNDKFGEHSCFEPNVARLCPILGNRSVLPRLIGALPRRCLTPTSLACSKGRTPLKTLLSNAMKGERGPLLPGRAGGSPTAAGARSRSTWVLKAAVAVAVALSLLLGLFLWSSGW
jgi:hypothetical protein